MSRKVDRWLSYGRKRCAGGDHWYILDFGDYLVCPICGCKRDKTELDLPLTEYNCFLVNAVKIERAAV